VASAGLNLPVFESPNDGTRVTAAWIVRQPRK